MSANLREELPGNSERSQPTETKGDSEARNYFWSPDPRGSRSCVCASTLLVIGGGTRRRGRMS